MRLEGFGCKFVCKSVLIKICNYTPASTIYNYTPASTIYIGFTVYTYFTLIQIWGKAFGDISSF